MTFQKRYQFLLLVSATWELALSHRHFQLAIPNGDRVPHPCGGNIDQSWQGAGHINPLGGGARNPFGEAFATNHFQWTELLCRADSDGDGRTNGEELGDPACHWIPGTDFHRKPLSHPGICEPLDSPVCAGKNSFLACREDENFACDAINESETFGLSIKLPQTPVPIRSTSSVCMDFEFTYDVIHHLVATSPIIGTGGVAHSIHVYACAGGPSRPLRSPYECETESMLCQNLIAVWRKGLKGECHGPDVGIPVGGASDSGYRNATMQVQLTNPDLQANIEDSSGLDFFLTPKLRTHSAGYFYFGPRYLEIPPGVPQHTAQGRLKDHCTREVLQGPIKVMRVLGQMHSAGVSQETTLSREGRINNYLAVDNPYSWEQSREHWHPGGVEVRPGDELLTTCKYNTTARHVTTFWGEGDRHEQCFAHILYYPRENIVNPHFKSWGSIEPCEMILGKTAQSCELDLWRDPHHIMGVDIRMKVQEKCRPGKCLEECMAYVRDVKMTACFHGDVDTYLREPINMTSQERLAHLHHYAALDSCDVQLARERCKMEAGGAGKLVMHVVMMVVLFTCQELVRVALHCDVV